MKWIKRETLCKSCDFAWDNLTTHLKASKNHMKVGVKSKKKHNCGLKGEMCQQEKEFNGIQWASEGKRFNSASAWQEVISFALPTDVSHS